MSNRVSFFLCFLVLLLIGCAHEFVGNTEFTGTGSEVEGKYAIKGMAVDHSGEPVAGALVRMRPKGFLALYADKFLAFDTITDEYGRFYFDSASIDSYTIEINKNGKYGALELTHCALEKR